MSLAVVSTAAWVRARRTLASEVVDIEALLGSYDQATVAIEDRCGKALGKRQAEELVVAAAVDVDDFYRCTVPPPRPSPRRSRCRSTARAS
ncbi:hypothetical protein OG866_01425 [Streptomyces sp. NBC_00663]|uniref:hypothetical protein n=1 Tax=Streptomyces sp. NBC_00663 TaxID=2975801 RepID=UPI002E36B246|nr:hypothetical protein [Streptomyces sp. NBC_00663]